MSAHSTRRVLGIRQRAETWPVPPVRDDTPLPMIGQARIARRTGEGLITSYVHEHGKVGVLVEVNCETEASARSEAFRTLAAQLAEHIAIAAPIATHRRAVPPQIVDRKHRLFVAEARAQGKPERHIEMIVEGRMEVFFRAVVLMDQAWVRGGDITIAQLLKEASTRIGEPVHVRRFSRFHMGIA